MKHTISFRLCLFSFLLFHRGVCNKGRYQARFVPYLSYHKGRQAGRQGISRMGEQSFIQGGRLSFFWSLCALILRGCRVGGANFRSILRSRRQACAHYHWPWGLHRGCISMGRSFCWFFCFAGGFLIFLQVLVVLGCLFLGGCRNATGRLYYALSWGMGGLRCTIMGGRDNPGGMGSIIGVGRVGRSGGGHGRGGKNGGESGG